MNECTSPLCDRGFKIFHEFANGCRQLYDIGPTVEDAYIDRLVKGASEGG